MEHRVQRSCENICPHTQISGTELYFERVYHFVETRFSSFINHSPERSCNRNEEFIQLHLGERSSELRKPFLRCVRDIGRGNRLARLRVQSAAPILPNTSFQVHSDGSFSSPPVVFGA